uniref:Uncharacterized protein n=1 Tax=viral metagenome TaxID=1070528 RepID=A0A6M3J3K1_9ZZZZ
MNNASQKAMNAETKIRRTIIKDTSGKIIKRVPGRILPLCAGQMFFDREIYAVSEIVADGKRERVLILI